MRNYSPQLYPAYETRRMQMNTTFLLNEVLSGGQNVTWLDSWGLLILATNNTTEPSVSPLTTAYGRSGEPCQIISDDVRNIVIIVNMAILCQVISVVGVFLNVINICVFVKQGFSDTLNVTLVGLAIADLGIVVFAVWLCICYNPLFSTLDLPFKPNEFVYLTAGLPRLTLSRISSWILASASFERCLCITMPLTFKSIVTPRRSTVFITGAFIIMTASVAPIYHTSRLVWVFDPLTNKSTASLAFTPDRFTVDNVSFAIGVFLSVSSFVAVAACTSVLVWSLKKTSQWHEKSNATLTSAQAAATLTSRNKRVGKMVSMVSVLFVVCYTPNTVNQLVMSMVKDFAKNGSQVNANQVCWSFGFLFESLNATMNFVVYVKMSSRFRKTLREIFLRKPTSSGKPEISA